MNNYKPPRQATRQERKKLALYLTEKEFGSSFREIDLEVVQEAVDLAGIAVFPDWFKDGNMITVAWSEEYPQLPNHLERFKYSKAEGFTLLRHEGRRKYHKAK